jgi:hypothetical protein
MSLNPSRPHTSATDGTGRRSPRTQHDRARRLSQRSISDAVVAGYLHDISQSRRRSTAGRENRVLLPAPER